MKKSVNIQNKSVQSVHFFGRKLDFSFLKTLFRMQKISYLLNFKEFFFSEMSQKKCISRLFKNPYKKYVQTVKF